MNNEILIEQVKTLLTQQFQTPLLAVTDDSADHIGHRSNQQGGAHLTLTIRTQTFNGLPLLKRHRMIYNVLQPLLQQSIHALRIFAYSEQDPKENNHVI